MQKALRIGAAVLLFMALPILSVGAANASAASVHDCPQPYFDYSTGLWYGNIGLWQYSDQTGPFVCLPDASPNDQDDLSKVHYPNGLDVAHHVASVSSQSYYLAAIICTGTYGTGSCTIISPSEQRNLASPYLNHVLSLYWIWAGR